MKSECTWGRRGLLVAAVTLVAAVGCGGNDSNSGGGSPGGGTSGGASKPKGGGTVTIGNLASIAGIGGVFDGFQAGVKGYFEYQNANGGINGTKVKLVTVDDGGDPGKAAAGARKLVAQDKVLAIVGMASLADAAVAKYLNAQGTPVVGGWATSSSWHKPNTNMFVNIEGPNKPYCSVWSNDVAKAEGVTKMAYIAQDFPSAIQDADCRRVGGKNVGIAIAGPRIDVSLTAADYRPPMQRAIKSGANGIYFSTGTDGQLKGIEAGEQLGYKGKYVPTQPSGLEKGLASMASKLDGRVLTSAFSLLPTDPDSVSAELAAFKKGMKQYEPKYADEITAVSGWAAGRMFADALKAAGPDKKAIIAYLSKQKAYTFGGLQGPVDYTNGNTALPCTLDLVLKGGKFVRANDSRKPSDFLCGPILDFSGKVVAYQQYAKNS